MDLRMDDEWLDRNVTPAINTKRTRLWRIRSTSVPNILAGRSIEKLDDDYLTTARLYSGKSRHASSSSGTIELESIEKRL